MPTLVRDLFKTLNVPTLMRVTKLGEMPITLRIHTPYIHLLNVRDKIGGDANYLTDSHIICTSLNVIHKIGGDANLLTDDFLEKHSGCLGAFGPSAAALRLDKVNHSASKTRHLNHN